MILACQNISKAFGTTEIIKNASFHIEKREKAALVGINGAGKSTLLKIIIGEMRADEGEVILSKGKTMGYLAQHQDLTGHLSIYQEVLTAKPVSYTHLDVYKRQAHGTGTGKYQHLSEGSLISHRRAGKKPVQIFFFH